MTKIHIDDLLVPSAIGTVDAAMALAIRGLSTSPAPFALPLEQDQAGYTFFTKPMINMSAQNLANDGRLTPLLTTNPLSIQRACRLLLDSGLAFTNDDLISPLIDRFQAFNPILSNTLISMSGWADPVLNYHTSTPGLMGERWVTVDSSFEMYDSFTLTATFSRAKGGLAHLLMYYHMLSMSLLFRNQMTAYPKFISSRTKCYEIRPYRVILDSSKRYVTHFGYAINMIPVGLNYGEIFDFNLDNPLGSRGKDLQVSFAAVGASYNDPLGVRSFNRTVAGYKAEMWDDTREGTMHRVEAHLMDAFKGFVYPYIDPESMAFSWWTDIEHYDRIMRALEALDSGLASANR